MLIRPTKIPKFLSWLLFATSLLSILDPNSNFDPSLGLGLDLGLGWVLGSGLGLRIVLGCKVAKIFLRAPLVPAECQAP